VHEPDAREWQRWEVRAAPIFSTLQRPSWGEPQRDRRLGGACTKFGLTRVLLGHPFEGRVRNQCVPERPNSAAFTMDSKPKLTIVAARNFIASR